MAPSDSRAQAARTYGGQNSDERAARRRARFIEVAVQLFGTVGYHGTSVRALTAQAGLNNRYFYESFDTMEDLLIACYEHVTCEFLDRMRAAVDSAPDDLASQLRAVVRCYFEEMRDPHFARITQVEVLGVSTRVDTLYMRRMREFAAFGLGILSRHNVNLTTAVKKSELELVGFALVGAITMAGAAWLRSRYRESIDTVTNATLKILVGTADQLARSSKPSSP